MRKSVWQKGCALATLIWIAGIAWGSLSPAAELPQHLPWDKFNHFVAYAGLAAGLRLTGCRWATAWMAAVAFSIAIEYLQLWAPGRHGGDWNDILANALGAACGCGLGQLILWLNIRFATGERHR